MEDRIDRLAGEIETETFALVSGRFNILFINFVDSDAATALLGDLQREFVSDNQFYYNVSMWDPAQLPLPRTNDLQISLSGPDEAQLVLLLEEIRDLVNESDLYARVFTDPPTGLSNQIAMRIRPEVLDGFSALTEAELTTLTGPYPARQHLDRVRYRAGYPGRCGEIPPRSFWTGRGETGELSDFYSGRDCSLTALL